MAPTQPIHGSEDLLSVIDEIYAHTSELIGYLKAKSIAPPSLAVGARTELWNCHANEVEVARSSIIGLTKQLTKLLEGPHGFLHEYVSSNWDHGALYTLLQYDILEHIPLNGQADVQTLAQKSGLPADKLLCILRLNACEQILNEDADGMFSHTAISEELVNDDEFKAWVDFQLFETRVASAHLSDSLKENNQYWTGPSAFKHAWGEIMYDWHEIHPAKGARFAKAMAGVGKSLDPGNSLCRGWFERNQKEDQNIVIDIGGKDGKASRFLAGQFPHLNFEVQEPSESLIARGMNELALRPDLEKRITFNRRNVFQSQPTEGANNVLAYLLQNILWNLPDGDCCALLQAFIPALKASPNTVILVNDLMSPARGTFKPHEEKAYRRRDVTLTTMHNVKQRTEQEWRALFASACADFEVNLNVGYTSHSCRGLWELRYKPAN